MKRIGQVSKMFLAAVLSLAMIIAVWTPGTALVAKAAGTATTTTTTASKDEVTIQVLSTSDLHGKFVPYDYAQNVESKSGSLAQVATLVAKYRKENADTLLIDCGDTIQDNSADLFLQDDIHPMIAGMNMMNYDVMVPGNHEFNYGVPTLKNIFSKVNKNTTILSANIYNSDGKTRTLGAPYKIFTKDGVNIAVIGVTTPNITRWDAANLAKYVVTDPVVEVNNAIKEIGDKADVIIVAAHMGPSNEYGVADSGVADLADKCPGVDLILAAHEHQLVNGTKYNGIPVVENMNQGQTLGVSNITVKKDSAGKYQISAIKTDVVKTNTTDADADMVKALASYDQRAKADAVIVIGKLTGGSLVADDTITGIPQGQIADSALVDLINKVQMYYAGADVSAAAMFNWKANVKPGDIRKCDVASIYKFANTLYKVQMTGKQLKEYMEWSAKYYNTLKDGDLTPSFNKAMPAYNYDMFEGVNYTINLSKPEGSRIENLTWPNGTAVKDTDVFILAVNNYRYNSQLARTGEVFQTGEELPKLLEGDVKGGTGIRELIRDYIMNVKKGVLTPDVDNNWKLTGLDWNDAVTKKIAGYVTAGKLKIDTPESTRTPNLTSITKADIEKLGDTSVVKVTLDNNDGTGTTSSCYVVKGEAYGTLPEVTRSGYKFAGWFTEKEQGSRVTEGTKADITTDTTIYAQWKKVTAPSKAKLTSVKSTKKKSVTVKFKAVSKAEGYVITYSYSSKFAKSKTRTVTTTKLSYTIKKLTSGKKVYVKVKAMVKDSTGKAFNGKNSTVMSVRVK